MRYKNLIFDLDGTVSNPKNGITGGVQHALSKLGIVENDPERLLPYIGPPLARSFQDFHSLNDDQVEKAVRFYRERFAAVGLYENELYEGIDDLLRSLTEHGYTLTLATSKLEHFAEKILEHFSLTKYFRFMAGSTMDGLRSEKGDVIRHVLQENGFLPSQTLMIGDTKYDVEGALENGIDSVAVGYGYGDWQETLRSGPTYVCGTVGELKDLLIRLAADDRDVLTTGGSMRTEQEMFDLILGFARNDPRIRAVYMNGSRADPHAKKDIFQDYDIVYVVSETRPFIHDRSWLEIFGERAVMQEPDNNLLYEDVSAPDERYAYLLQFEDGNRIDLTLQTPEVAKVNYLSDSLTFPLLDKDGLFPEIPPPSGKDYLVQKPDASMFFNCCNEFWWVSPYIAKGLWRKEILYAMEHLEKCVRPMLLMMLSWEAGIRTGFSVSVGKSHKHLERYLPAETWTCLLKTFPEAEEQAVWKAVFEAGGLFRKTADFVARELGFVYDTEEDRRTTALLRDIRALPRDAADFQRGGTECT